MRHLLRCVRLWSKVLIGRFDCDAFVCLFSLTFATSTFVLVPEYAQDRNSSTHLDSYDNDYCRV